MGDGLLVWPGEDWLALTPRGREEAREAMRGVSAFTDRKDRSTSPLNQVHDSRRAYPLNFLLLELHRKPVR
jgi:hypothetical protein